MERMLVALFIGLSTCWAMAGEGGMSSGGGGAFVLRDANGKVVSAELLDLWEARMVTRPVLDIEYSEDPVQTQVLRALKKLERVDSYFYQLSLEALEYLQNPKNIDDKPEEVEIAPPEDAKNKYKKKGWPLEGMFLFDGDTKMLSRKKEIFNALQTKTDAAAAWVHEATYKVLRENLFFRAQIGLSPSSKPARNLTACLFSKTPCWNEVGPEDSLPTDRPIYLCSDRKTVRFYMYKLSESPTLDPIIGNQTFAPLSPGQMTQTWRMTFTNFGPHKFGVETYLDAIMQAVDNTIFGTQSYFGTKGLLHRYNYSGGSLYIRQGKFDANSAEIDLYGLELYDGLSVGLEGTSIPTKLGNKGETHVTCQGIR